MTDASTKPVEERTATTSFVLVLRQIIWIEDEARRLGKNKSELIRDILDAAIAEREAKIASAA